MSHEIETPVVWMRCTKCSKRFQGKFYRPLHPGEQEVAGICPSCWADHERATIERFERRYGDKSQDHGGSRIA